MTAFDIVIACAAASLILLGWITALMDQTATTTAVLSFAVVLFLILLATRFKFVRGFGFHAESWDQKQVEAAKLIERLSTVSEAITRYVALVASKLGDSHLSNWQLAELLTKTDALLQTSEVPKVTRDEILEPVIDRIKTNYYNAGLELAISAIDTAMDDIASARNDAGVPEPERTTLRSKHVALSEAKLQLRADVVYRRLAQRESLDPIIEVIQTTEFPDRENTLNALRELDDDLKYFSLHRKLLREIPGWGTFR